MKVFPDELIKNIMTQILSDAPRVVLQRIDDTIQRRIPDGSDAILNMTLGDNNLTIHNASSKQLRQSVS